MSMCAEIGDAGKVRLGYSIVVQNMQAELGRRQKASPHRAGK